MEKDKTEFSDNDVELLISDDDQGDNEYSFGNVEQQDHYKPQPERKELSTPSSGNKKDLQQSTASMWTDFEITEEELRMLAEIERNYIQQSQSKETKLQTSSKLGQHINPDFVQHFNGILEDSQLHFDFNSPTSPPNNSNIGSNKPEAETPSSKKNSKKKTNSSTSTKKTSKTTKITSSETKTPKKSQKPMPHFKRVEGTPFIVDGFRHQSEEFKSYFLSHFHSDHYMGLTKTFKAGTICKYHQPLVCFQKFMFSLPQLDFFKIVLR